MRSFDVRFSAFLACSPQGIGRLGMTANLWSSVAVPMMVQNGEVKISTVHGFIMSSRKDLF